MENGSILQELRSLRHELEITNNVERKKEIKEKIISLMYKRFPTAHHATFASLARDVDPFVKSANGGGRILGDDYLFHQNSQAYLAHLRIRYTKLSQLEFSVGKTLDELRKNQEGNLGIVDAVNTAEVDRAEELHERIVRDARTSRQLLSELEQFVEDQEQRGIALSGVKRGGGDPRGSVFKRARVMPT